MIRRFSGEVRSGNAALFVGAGLSRQSGFVDWRELMREIASDLKLDVDRESDLIALAQYHVNERRGRAGINRLLLEEFTKDAKLTENHKLIATLPIQCIWTTNYDELLEAAFTEAHRRPDVKTTSANLATTLPNRDVVLYKMHGDCRQPQEAILTKEDYETYGEKREVFSTALKGDLVERTFLFLGFSFVDPNIDYILSRIRGLLGQNQREHYCIMKWPDPPKDDSGGERAEYEYQKRKLELRISDLSRYHIQAVMIDKYDEITEILQEISRRSCSRHIFVSGSAIDFQPLGEERLKNFCGRLGREAIERGLSLVSGFGLSIGGAVALGALEAIYTRELPLQRLSLFPFPRRIGTSLQKLYTDYRRSMLSKAGFAIFIAGNRRGPDDAQAVEGPGVIEEFDISCKLGKIPIPFGASGWAARSIWQKVMAKPEEYYGQRNVSAALLTLGDAGRTEDEHIGAIFSIIEELNR
jgi:hypothetical protein